MSNLHSQVLDTLRVSRSAQEKIDRFEELLLAMDEAGTDSIEVPGFLGVPDIHTRRQVLNALQCLTGKKPIAWGEPANEYDQGRAWIAFIAYPSGEHRWQARCTRGGQLHYSPSRFLKSDAERDAHRLRMTVLGVKPASVRCPRGHYLTKSNTGRQKNAHGLARYCKTCKAARDRRAYEKRKTSNGQSIAGEAKNATAGNVGAMRGNRAEMGDVR